MTEKKPENPKEDTPGEQRSNPQDDYALEQLLAIFKLFGTNEELFNNLRENSKEKEPPPEGWVDDFISAIEGSEGEVKW